MKYNPKDVLSGQFWIKRIHQILGGRNFVMNARPTRLTVSIKDLGKQVHVSCGIIQRDNFVLAVQRSPQMHLPLKWEFPGGKIEQGETPEACLKRELIEELELSVTVGDALEPSTHVYDSFIVTLYPFLCDIESGKLVLHEHAAFAWLQPSKLHELDWADADKPVLDAYLKMTGFQRKELP